MVMKGTTAARPEATAIIQLRKNGARSNKGRSLEEKASRALTRELIPVQTVPE